MKNCFLSISLLLSVTLTTAATAADPAYPMKPIRVVTSEAGGGLDYAGRLIAPGVSATLGQQMIVDNRGGAGGAIAIETVIRAQPDGYTLLIYGSSVWLLPLMKAKAPWDPLADLAPITLAVTSPNILVVNPKVPVGTVKELIALAKAKPGEVTYASGGGAGSTGHLSAELFKAMAGVNMTHVPYKGNGPALNAVISGEVQLTFGNVAACIPHMKSGRLKALAVTSAQPFAVLPELPTVSASGVPGYEAGTLMGLFAPAKTPAAIVKRLNQAIVAELSRPEIREKFLNAGLEVVASTPQQLQEAMKADMTRVGKVIREAGIRAE